MRLHKVSPAWLDVQEVLHPAPLEPDVPAADPAAGVHLGISSRLLDRVVHEVENVPDHAVVEPTNYSHLLTHVGPPLL